MTITIYHNPKCGTSRNVLAMIRNSGEEPRIVEYLRTPPSRAELVDLIARMNISPRELLRRKGTPYDELGLDNPALTDDELIDLMLTHPILIDRPIVVTPLGVRLCRPSEAVLAILPNPQHAPFVKEDGEVGPAADPRPGGRAQSCPRKRSPSSAWQAAEAARQRPALGLFERYLTVWVALCIVAGIALGHCSRRHSRRSAAPRSRRSTCRSRC